MSEWRSYSEVGGWMVVGQGEGLLIIIPGRTNVNSENGRRTRPS